MSLRRSASARVAVTLALGVISWSPLAAAADEAEPPSAPPAAPASPVEAARLELEDYRFEEALAAAERALDAGGLDALDTRSMLEVRALSLAALNRPEASTTAFKALLLADATYQLPPELGPRIQTPFLEARAFWREVARSPLVVRAQRGEEGCMLAIRVADPLGLFARVELLTAGGDAPFESQRRAVASEVRFPVASETTRFIVRVRDLHGNVIAEIGSEASPERLLGEPCEVSPRPTSHGDGAPAAPPELGVDDAPAWYEHPLFWIGAGVAVAGAGAATAVALSQ